MFSFVTKYLGGLKSIPGMPHLFDAMLRLWTLLTAPVIQDCLDELEAEVMKWDGANITLHKYGGMQFNYHSREFGHVHSNGVLDIRFNRKLKQQLMLEGKINNHHLFEKSGWVSFYIRKADDAAYAKQLLKMAYHH
jgi:hypothetical protein